MRYIAFVALMLATACAIFLSGFSLPTTFSLVVLLLAVSSDYVTTWLCARAMGREGNPVIAFLFRKIGIYGTFGVMACMWIVFVVFRWLPEADGVQTAVAFTYWLVVVNNLSVLARLRRKSAR